MLFRQGWIDSRGMVGSKREHRGFHSHGDGKSDSWKELRFSIGALVRRE